MRPAFATLLLAFTLLGCAPQQSARDARDDCGAPMLAAASERGGQGASDATDGWADLSDPRPYPPVEAMVVPPAGWQPEPLKNSRKHAHQVWLSPTGSTAYGVIRINLPLPFIGPDAVLRPFLDEMRKTEGKATLISRQNDRRLPGIRFVAEGGQYRIRANLMTRGFRAWAVYAGTRVGAEEVPEEVELAERARERTKIGTQRSRS